MPLYTAQDVCDYLMSGTGGGSQDGEHRVIRGAVHHAYRDLCEARDWLWHVKTGEFTTDGVNADYDLPADVKNLDALLSPSVGTLRYYISPTDYLRLNINSSPAGDPFYFTVMRIGDNPYLSVRFVGVPTALTFQYLYRQRPEPLSKMGFEPRCRAGDVTVTSGSTSVTGANGADFGPDMVGSAIRFSRNAVNYPESLSGLYPYAFESKIAAVPNSTTLTLEDAAPQDFTAVKYYISDVLDVSPGMYTAVLSGAELWYARLAGKGADQPLALYQRDIRLAMETDVTNPLSGRREGWLEYPLTPRLAGYYSVQLPDQGV